MTTPSPSRAAYMREWRAKRRGVAGRSVRHWTRAELLHMKWYAERGFSANETGKMLDRSEAAVARKAQEIGLSFHGPSGAPFLNRNGARGTFIQILRSSS